MGDANVIYQDRSLLRDQPGRGEARRDHPRAQERQHRARSADRLGGDRRRPPTTTRTSPIGQLLDGVPDRSVMNQVAVVGLGAGSMACLSQTGENWTFFEIDPAVVKLASDPKLFSFLRDCDGDFDVQVGDGRLSLRRGARRQVRADRARRLQLRRHPDPSDDARGGRALREQAAPGRDDRVPHLEQVPGPRAGDRQRRARRAGSPATGRPTCKMQRGALYKYPSRWVVAAAGRARTWAGWLATRAGTRCATEPGARPGATTTPTWSARSASAARGGLDARPGRPAKPKASPRRADTGVEARSTV